MTEPVAKPTRASRWRRVRLFALLAVLVLLVAYLGTGWYAGRALDAELARLEPKYGNLRVRSLVAPPVPATENRAKLVGAASALALPFPQPLQESLRKVGNSTDADAMPADLRAFVDQNHEALEIAAKIVTRPKASWDVDYGDGGGSLPLLEARNLANILYLKAMMELEAHRPDEAARWIANGLASASSLSNEPQLIAQLVRIAMADRHFTGIQRLLSQSDPSKASLEELARWLKDSRSDPSRTGLEAELAYFSSTLSRLEAGRRDGTVNDQFAGLRLFPRVSRSFVQLAHARYLRKMDELLTIQAGQRPRPEWNPEPASWWSPLDVFVKVGLPGLARTMQTGDDYMSTLGAAEISVALRRYKLDHAAYPDHLEALMPAYLDKLPINPYTGKAPVYVPENTGFTIQAPRDEHNVPRRPLKDWKLPK